MYVHEFFCDWDRQVHSKACSCMVWCSTCLTASCCTHNSDSQKPTNCSLSWPPKWDKWHRLAFKKAYHVVEVTTFKGLNLLAARCLYKVIPLKAGKQNGHFLKAGITCNVENFMLVVLRSEIFLFAQDQLLSCRNWLTSEKEAKLNVKLDKLAPFYVLEGTGSTIPHYSTVQASPGTVTSHWCWGGRLGLRVPVVHH